MVLYGRPVLLTGPVLEGDTGQHVSTVSLSSSLVHFQMLKNLKSFEDLNPKIFWEKLHSFGKYCPNIMNFA